MALIRSMHMQGPGGRKGPLQRPKTTATGTKDYDSRIKDKLKYLGDLESKIETDV